MRRALLACALLLLASCAGPEGPRPGAQIPAPREERDVLDTLARELDPGPQSALWPQIPADVRARVEAGAPRDAAPAARLAAARERLAHWTLQVSTTDPTTLAPQLERAFEGVYLAEPLALAAGNAPATLEARALLWSFYNAFMGTQPLLRSFEATRGRAGTKLGTSMDATELLTGAGAKLSERLAAEILRARAPETTVDDILWMEGSRERRTLRSRRS